ncbi:MAG: dinitrogenase iron-molybdenum cofactor biosynthesis protein [Kiritimatiellaeota bacterium]|nr:dinitrogenase iron-molybdenum cofactor biosynthesis protein [Kiritimatiellota bacterium]
MKVVVTSQGETLDAQVDPRFGRAKNFIILDTENGEFKSIDNSQNLNAAQGAGIQSAQNVANTDTEALITGNCGPKAFKVLAAAKIKVYIGAQGTVSEAVEKFKNGELKEAANANVEGHW